MSWNNIVQDCVHKTCTAVIYSLYCLSLSIEQIEVSIYKCLV